MDIISELNRIGKSEINFSISYFFDNNWIVKLGDELNGFIWTANCNSFNECVNRLIQAIIKEYPKSDYIKQLHKRSSAIFMGLDFF